MRRVFVDTSALLALVMSTDRAHPGAAAAFTRLQGEQATLVTTSYVLLETYALLGRRAGLNAVQTFREELAPLLRVVWVGDQEHDRGLDHLLAQRASKLSLVDAVSFVVMTEQGLDEALAFDEDFTRAGFSLVS